MTGRVEEIRRSTTTAAVLKSGVDQLFDFNDIPNTLCSTCGTKDCQRADGGEFMSVPHRFILTMRRFYQVVEHEGKVSLGQHTPSRVATITTTTPLC